MDNQADIPYRIEVTLGGDADISVVEDEIMWRDEGECEFIVRSPNHDEMVFYADLETSIEAMEHLKEIGCLPDAM